jgi:hypothetical protein
MGAKARRMELMMVMGVGATWTTGKRKKRKGKMGGKADDRNVG